MLLSATRSAISPLRLLLLLSFVALATLSYSFWLTGPPEAQGKYEGRILDYGRIQIPSEAVVQDPVNQAEIEARCASLPGASDVLVVLRTSATELYQKVPQQLLTLLRCTPHFRIFADLDTDVAGHHVTDVLDSVSAEARQANEEFRIHERIKSYHSEGQRLDAIEGEVSQQLDRWKFIPMLHRAYEERPRAKWFLFMEADTSVSWTNLLQLLGRLNHKAPLYFGAQNYLGNMGFAEGGSGFVISNGAMKKFVSQWPSAKQGVWEGIVSRHLYGDEIVGEALLAAGVSLTHAFPMMQGESPATLDWTARHWCRPAITWHNMSSHEVDAMWKFQNAWISSKGWKTPYLLKDVFTSVVQPRLAPDLPAWDNLSGDWVFAKPAADASPTDHDVWLSLPEPDRAAVESFESCRGACVERQDCVQFSYAPGRCQLGRVVRLGRRAQGGGGGGGEGAEAGVRSGWMLKRIERLKRSWEPCEMDWALR